VKEVRVTIPHIAESDLVDLLSSFFSRGNDDARKRLELLFKRPHDLTVVMTSKSVGDNSIQIEVL
jgi:hypothetical protein